MTNQDKFYLEKESDAFFDRWWAAQEEEIPTAIRESKGEILTQLLDVRDLSGLTVLEIGSFISDLLGHLNSNFGCKVFGVEPSGKACAYARRQFGIDVENATFSKSSFFSLDGDNRCRFDLIICDDVLSWMERDLILPSLGVIDWMLKPGGSIFLRDFSPTFGFAFENHHWPGNKIYNFKQPGGHRQFFLSTGKYLEVSTHVRTDPKYQKVETGRPDSMTWADSILTKMEDHAHPLQNMS